MGNVIINLCTKTQPIRPKLSYRLIFFVDCWCHFLPYSNARVWTTITGFNHIIRFIQQRCVVQGHEGWLTLGIQPVDDGGKSQHLGTPKLPKPWVSPEDEFGILNSWDSPYDWAWSVRKELDHDGGRRLSTRLQRRGAPILEISGTYVVWISGSNTSMICSRCCCTLLMATILVFWLSNIFTTCWVECPPPRLVPEPSRGHFPGISWWDTEKNPSRHGEDLELVLDLTFPTVAFFSTCLTYLNIIFPYFSIVFVPLNLGIPWFQVAPGC